MRDDCAEKMWAIISTNRLGKRKIDFRSPRALGKRNFLLRQANYRKKEKKRERQKACLTTATLDLSFWEIRSRGEAHRRRKLIRAEPESRRSTARDISNANRIYHFLAGSLESIVADELLMCARRAVGIGATCCVFSLDVRV